MVRKGQVVSARTAAAVSKAALRASEYLGLKQKEFAQIVGVSPTKVSHLWAADYQLNSSIKSERENSILFIRLFKSLDAVLSDKEAARVWLRGENTALGDSPFNLIQSIEGLVHVVNYLESQQRQMDQ
ncbi:unannotated protein [freshwater metagenome]|uniref:Unannotated protein n=1 Tax=freshwater metagenome TaxID=449393 RepID=A0A6J7TL87_9ZZZZ|nr:DUF2384 domain-containing protein [Actinomycetota bacterium]